VTTAELAGRAARVHARGRSVARVVPAWLWLAGLVAVSAGVRFAFASRYPGPWIFGDEIRYSDLARSLGRSGHFELRGVPGANGTGPVYPTLIAPAYAIFGSMPHAYLAVKAINSVVMSLVAVPTYLAGRRFLRPGFALLAALFSVAIPELTYTASVMTEVAFYPAFMATAYATLLALERPTVRRQILMFVPLVVAFFTRPSGAVFVPAIVTAIVLLATVDAAASRRPRSFLAGLARYWVTWLALAIGAAIVILGEVARGRSPRDVLGSNSGVLDFRYSFSSIARWWLIHLGDLDVITGVLPLAALLLLAFVALRPRERDPAVRAFAALAVATVFWFTAMAAAYAANPIGDRIEERYLFEVVPLIFLAFALWVQRSLARPEPEAGAAAAISAAVPGAVSWSALLTQFVGSSALGLIPLLRLEQNLASEGSIGEIVTLCAIGGALVFLLLPRRWAFVAPGLVLAYLVGAHRPVERLTHLGSTNGVRASFDGPRNWIDRAVGRDADVSILYYAVDALPYQESEFFNASVRRVLTIPGNYDGLPQTQVQVASSGAILTRDSKVARTAYVLTNQALLPRGRAVARDPLAGLTVYRTAGPLRLQAKIDGVYPDRWSGPEAGYTRYACAGGSLGVTLLSDPGLFPQPQTVAASIAGKDVAQKTFRPTLKPVSFRVPLRATAGECAVSFSVSPTVVPAQARPGNPDTRALGVRFLRFDYRPRPAR
jgi:hypothetical protein